MYDKNPYLVFYLLLKRDYQIYNLELLYRNYISFDFSDFQNVYLLS